MPMSWNAMEIDRVADKANQVLRAVGMAMVRDIKTSMRSTARDSRGVSKPDHAPAPQTGDLLSAVIMDDTKAYAGKVRVGVAGTAPYGEHLERPKPDRIQHRRPFLEPAMNRAVDAFDGLVSRAEE